MTSFRRWAYLQVAGLGAVPGHRHARAVLPRTAAGRRVALPLAGRDLHQGPPEWPHRVDRGNNRHRRQPGRPPRDPRARSGPVGSRHLLDRETYTFRLRGLVHRGLKGVKLVISDAHEGLKAAITQVLSATWQRCRVHFMRSLLAYVPKSQQLVV